MRNKCLSFALLCLTFGTIGAQVDEKCLSCLRQYENGPRNSCSHNFITKTSCGIYKISEPFWVACGRPGYSWGHCTTDSKCSADCLNAYFRRYASRCANMLKKPVSELTCADYVRLHHGPDGCGMSASLRHSRAITSCLWPANMFSS
ncbi:hypothetical protein EB796_022240 [Bugula neritina]|nr:hypothetical protein EB796_022240 [Bugula neritina]